MIGGGGEKKTLRHVARYADMWNGFGTPEEFARKLGILHDHCSDVGRDPQAILPTVLIGALVRDDPADIRPVMEAVAARHGLKEVGEGGPAALNGTVESIAQGFAAYYRAGARAVLFSVMTPYDRETVERVAREVRPRVQELIN